MAIERKTSAMTLRLKPSTKDKLLWLAEEKAEVKVTRWLEDMIDKEAAKKGYAARSL